MIRKAKSSDSAVSPVIGTILLVAIAVVLVAIILAVVMGFSGDPNEKKVGLNAKSESGANATLILYGGASIDELVQLEMIDQGSPDGEYVKFWNINDDGSAYVGLPYPVLNVARPPESMAVYDTRINVRGTFIDGTEVILLIQPMTFYNVVKEIETIMHPNILAPQLTNHKMVPDAGVTADFTVSYTDIDAVLTGGKLYYESADGTIKGSVDAVLTGDSASGGLSGSIPGLVPKVRYTIWGVFESANANFAGPSTTYTPYETTVYAPSFAVYPGGQLGMLLRIDAMLVNLDMTNPTVSVMCRRANEPATEWVLISGHPFNVSGIWYISNTVAYTNFEYNVEYEAWTLYQGYFDDVTTNKRKFIVPGYGLPVTYV